MLAKMGTADATHLVYVCVGFSTLHSKKIGFISLFEEKIRKNYKKK